MVRDSAAEGTGVKDGHVTGSFDSGHSRDVGPVWWEERQGDHEDPRTFRQCVTQSQMQLRIPILGENPLNGQPSHL